VMVVLGDRELEARTASVRRRDGSQEQGVAWDDLAERLATEAAERRVEAPASSVEDTPGRAKGS
jgi:threonyl-tRNA synthetase